MAKDMKREFLEKIQKRTEEVAAELLETGRVDIGNGIVVTIESDWEGRTMEDYEWFRQLIRCVVADEPIDFKDVIVPPWAQEIMNEEMAG